MKEINRIVMPEREKVINKVAAIVAEMQEEVDEWKDYSDSELRGGLTCDCDWWYKTLQTVKDALALLKAQEPHVIRFDEIDDYEVLWLEVRDVESEEGLAPWVKTRSGNWFSPLLCSELQPDMILSTPEEYGKYCRCWTSRPTDEQREAEPWND